MIFCFKMKLTSWVSALNNKDFLAWATLFTSLLGDQITTNHLFGKDFGIFWRVNNFYTTWSCSYLNTFKFIILLSHFFIRTFPWRPATPFFLKYPLPRPPAKTWAFTTQSGVGSFFAISNASSAEWATWPSGVFTPYSLKKQNYGLSIQIMNLPWGGQMRDIRELKDFFGKC